MRQAALAPSLPGVIEEIPIAHQDAHPGADMLPRRAVWLLAHTVGGRATGSARRTPGPGRGARGQGRAHHPYTTAPPRHRAPAALAAQTRRPGAAHSG